MAWHDEYPHKVYASVLLLDGKIEGWKTGNPAKKVPGEFKAYWKRDRLNDYTVEYVGFEVSNDQEHNDAFEILAPKWFRQWELADDLHGSPPYSDKMDAVRLAKEKIMAMEPGRELDASVAEKVMRWTGRKTVYRWDDRKAHRNPLIIFTDGDSKCASNYTPYVDDDGTKINYSEPHKVFIPSNYSTDISAAIEVAGKFDFYNLDKGGDYMNSQYGATVETCNEDGTYTAYTARARTLPEAICKAALLAKEET